MSRNKYPHWVCRICGSTASIMTQLTDGVEYSKVKVACDISTLHYGKCEVCGEMAGVTEARDFFYPDFSLVKHKKVVKKVKERELL